MHSHVIKRSQCNRTIIFQENMSDDILRKLKCVTQGKTMENKKNKKDMTWWFKILSENKLKYNYFITSTHCRKPSWPTTKWSCLFNCVLIFNWKSTLAFGREYTFCQKIWIHCEYHAIRWHKRRNLPFKNLCGPFLNTRWK